jgi:hypothetical protein
VLTIRLHGRYASKTVGRSILNTKLSHANIFNTSNDGCKLTDADDSQFDPWDGRCRNICLVHDQCNRMSCLHNFSDVPAHMYDIFLFTHTDDLYFTSVYGNACTNMKSDDRLLSPWSSNTYNTHVNSV